MTPEVFFNTYVLFYVTIVAGRDERKRKRALALIESDDFETSAQVLLVFFVTARIAERLRLHCTDVPQQWSNRTPRSASRSRLGAVTAVLPKQPRSVQLRSSEIRESTFGGVELEFRAAPMTAVEPSGGLRVISTLMPSADPGRSAPSSDRRIPPYPLSTTARP
jgi:hypothetical protein